MNTLSRKTLIIAAIAGFLAIVSMFALISSQSVKASPSFLSNILSTATSSTAYSVTSTANVRILATTTNPVGTPGVTSNIRVWASICNPSATIVALNMNADKPVTASSTTVFIGAAAGYSVCYEITDRNLYQGSVQASSTAGTVSVFTTSYVQ